MIKKKNQPVEQLHGQNESKNTVTNPYQFDINRMRVETISKLLLATYQAMEEVQGDREFGDVALKSEVFSNLWAVSQIGHDRIINMERKKEQYRKMELHDLLKQLYQRMQMFYHYAECMGAKLPGIAHHMEPNGWFTVNLTDCAMNMEHSFIDDQREGILFSIGLNLPLLDSEDPDAPESHLPEEYDEFLNFLCEFGTDSDKECCDVYPCEYSHEVAIRDILAQMDMISEMNNEKKQ